jgi:hypothetical protein
VEIDEIRIHSFLTIPYASVSGRARHLQPATFAPVPDSELDTNISHEGGGKP